MRIVLERDQGLVVRISAPADQLTLSGTFVFEETDALRSNYPGCETGPRCRGFLTEAKQTIMHQLGAQLGFSLIVS